MATNQFIYHMHGLSKAYAGGKKVLDNIHLSFYPDAKIGVLGPNGSGKSTLLRIMAGIDKEFTGEAWAPRARASATCRRSRSSIRAHDVRGNVMEGVAAKQAILDRYNELMVNYSDETADEATKLQDQIDAQGPLGPRSAGREGDGRAALPARRCRRSTSSRAARSAASRCASCCWRSPTCCCSTSRPTISTPRRVHGWRSICANYPGAILIVTHDRYFLDNVTGWILELDRGRGIPYEGNYSA